VGDCLGTLDQLRAVLAHGLPFRLYSMHVAPQQVLDGVTRRGDRAVGADRAPVSMLDQYEKLDDDTIAITTKYPYAFFRMC
jgi:hypothetical protein